MHGVIKKAEDVEGTPGPSREGTVGEVRGRCGRTRPSGGRTAGPGTCARGDSRGTQRPSSGRRDRPGSAEAVHGTSVFGVSFLQENYHVKGQKFEILNDTLQQKLDYSFFNPILVCFIDIV